MLGMVGAEPSRIPVGGAHSRVQDTRLLPSVIQRVLIMRPLCLVGLQALGIQPRLDGYISTPHRSQSGWRVEQETRLTQTVEK